MNSLFGGLETCLRNRAYLMGESTKYFTLQKHLAWFHIKLSLAHTSAFLGLRLDPVTLESSAKQSNTSVPMMRLHEMIVFQDLLCFRNWNLCQGKIFIIRWTFNFYKYLLQWTEGSWPSIRWQTSKQYMMLRSVHANEASDLGSKSRCTCYRSQIQQLTLKCIFSHTSFLWWDWVARYPEMQEYLNTAIFYHTF